MFADCEPLGGFHAAERDGLGPFVWTEGSYQLRLSANARFAHLKLCYNGQQGLLSVGHDRGWLDQATLGQGWQSCVLRLGNVSPGAALQFRISPLIPVVGDTRELGVMLRAVEFFDDRGRYDKLRLMAGNLRLNHGEYLVGATVLQSFPPRLRMNMEVRCNIPETSQACVYCPWDWAKEMEKGSPAIELTTFDAMGAYYQATTEIVDCSVGEPTMAKSFGPLVERFDQDGKQFSFTTNGQLLTAKRRREILGKDVLVYVSLDSATAAGYARYRNDRFDDLVANVKALCQEKKEHGNWPRVYVALIAMRSNVAELPQFFDLMRDLEVDEVKIRTLNLDDDVPHVTMNNGYRFDYAHEILSVDELEALTPVARRLARERGVALYIDWEQFAGDVHTPGAPLCAEPWKSLYMLRRGIMPCCYATRPLATWDEQKGTPLADFLAQAFNSDAYQEIRAELAAGRLGEYCRNTPSCPILKDMQQRGLVEATPNAFQSHAFAADQVAGEPSLPMVSLETLKRGNNRAA